MATLNGDTLITKGLIILCMKLLERKIDGFEFSQKVSERGYTQDQVTKGTVMAAKMMDDSYSSGYVLFSQVDLSAYV